MEDLGVTRSEAATVLTMDLTRAGTIEVRSFPLKIIANL
jgi:hypothetical protein